MCEFCNKNKCFQIPVNNKAIRNDNKEDCYFTLSRHKDVITFGFPHNNVNDTVCIKINFCPWCGEKLNNKRVVFKNYCIGKMTEVSE